MEIRDRSLSRGRFFVAPELVRRCRSVVDFGGRVSLLEVVVVGVEDDFAAEEEEDVDFEFCAEAGGEPEGIGLVR